MFKEEYILNLLSGQLTKKGYASIVGSVASMVKRYQWQKSIVVSGSKDPEWTEDDIKELTQLFFEWVMLNNKLKYVNRIPIDYLSYYFTQMFVSFISNRIKEEQQKIGISFQKCQELVKIICDEDYTTAKHLDRLYVVHSSSSTDKWITDLEDSIKYIAHYPIADSTKHFKPIVKLAIEDILISANGYVLIDILANAVYQLLDQSAFSDASELITQPQEVIEENIYNDVVKDIINGVSKSEAQIYLKYIFQVSGHVSLSDLASIYNMPKSTIHKKVEDFKNKIFSSYIPENEDDGVSFLQFLAKSLDEISK